METILIIMSLDWLTSYLINILVKTTRTLKISFIVGAYRLFCSNGLHQPILQADVSFRCQLSSKPTEWECSNNLEMWVRSFSAHPNFVFTFICQFPVLKIETNSGGGVSSGGNCLGNLPTPLYRTLVAFEKSILECHFLRDKSPAILRELEEVLQALSQFPDHLDIMIEQAGLKGKQSARVYDVHGWNLSLITTHVELLRQCQRDCGFILDQVLLHPIRHSSV